MKAVISLPGKKQERYAELVHIIRPGILLTKAEHQRFYGKNAKVKRKATKDERLVFKYREGGYCVIPNIERNQPFWRVFV